jgi:DNA-binding MarR family transcriptional regulator
MCGVSSSCEQNPFALLIGLADRLRLFFEECAATAGLTPTQAQVLMQLEEPRRITELAAASSCDPSSASTMIQRLERDGLVRRVIDPTDARARLVELTTKGTRARTTLAELVAGADEVVAGLPAEHRAALATMFSADTFAG